MNVLEMKSLEVTLPSGILRGSISVTDRERVAVMGVSGSGKSTIVRAIAGFISSTELGAQFSVHLNGRELTHLPPAKRNIGVVFQDAVMIPGLSVEENAAYGLTIRGISKTEALEAVKPWLHKVDLLNRAKFSVQGLSGGERQRISWVRALVWQPELILLDEPFSALDAQRRREMWSETLAFQQASRVPMLLVSHDSDEVQFLSTRQIVIRNHQLFSEISLPAR